MIERGESGAGTVVFGDRDRAVDRHDRRPGQRQERIIDPLDQLTDDARLRDYQPYWAARAGLMARFGDVDGADEAYRRAIGLADDPAVRRFLQRQQRLMVKRDALVP